MSFDKAEFLRFALENDVVGFHEDPVELSSGRLSHFYINWRNVTDNVLLTRELINFIFQFTRDRKLNPSTFYGVPEGATKLGILTQWEWATQSEDYRRKSYVLAMGRGKPKEHGMKKDREFLGQPTRDTIILEDVVVTGDSLSEEIKKLQSYGVPIIAAISLTDRSGMRDFLGVPYYALSNARDLFREGCKTLNPSQRIIKSIEEEFKALGY